MDSQPKTKSKTQTVTKEIPIPQYLRCARCGGRLFVETEYENERLCYFLECSIGCGATIPLNGSGPRLAATTKKQLREL